MGKMHRVTVNGQVFASRPGELLLDAALLNGVDIPHDCRSGQCGTCLCRLLDGHAIGGTGREPQTIHACQARIFSDLELVYDEVPDVVSVAGRVAAVRPLSTDTVEVSIAPSREFALLPGQYIQVQFAGFPARAFSPTVRLDAGHDKLLRFQIRRLPNGRVSSALGSDIADGHKVRLRGPFGSAFLRRERQNRLVLVSGGTGFAPIWAIADAALREWPERPLTMVVGVRSIESLYMCHALELLATLPNVALFVVAEMPQNISPLILGGRPTDHLPELSSDDDVIAAGPPPLVDAVAERARGAGATFRADPFVASAGSEGDFLARWRRNRARPGEPIGDAVESGSAA
jgi:NAD(P)H-flavin reductase/ferredoxin